MKVVPDNLETTSTVRWAITSDELRKWLLEYDAIHQGYPEHTYEGLAVWEFIQLKLEGKPGQYIFTSPYEHEWRQETKFFNP